MTPKIQWPLVLFSLLAGIGGCTFIFVGVATALGKSTAVTLPIVIVSLMLVCVGGLCSIAHLATPKNAIWAVTHLLSFSGISMELIMLGITTGLMCVYAAVAFFVGVGTVLTVIGTLGALAGLGLAFFTGHGYLISSKPTWNTKKLPLAYTGTALSGGGFVYLLVCAFLLNESGVISVLTVANLVCAVLSAITVMMYMSHIGQERRAKAGNIYSVGILLCSVAIPLICAAALVLTSSGSILYATFALAGCASTFIGGAALRMIMWIVGAGFLAFFEEAQATRCVLLNH